MEGVGVDNFCDGERAKPAVAELFEFVNVGVGAECESVNENKIVCCEWCWWSIFCVFLHVLECFLEGFVDVLVGLLMCVEYLFDCVVSAFNWIGEQIDGGVGVTLKNGEEWGAADGCMSCGVVGDFCLDEVVVPGIWGVACKNAKVLFEGAVCSFCLPRPFRGGWRWRNRVWCW